MGGEGLVWGADGTLIGRDGRAIPGVSPARGVAVFVGTISLQRGLFSRTPLTYRIPFGFRHHEGPAETMTAAWKLKRLLSYGLLGAALFSLDAYTRAQVRLSDLMVSEQASYEQAWREGYRLSPQDFRVRVQPDTFSALSRLTNSSLRGSPWPLPETIWWLRSTFVDPGADPQDTPVQWSDIEGFLAEDGVSNSQEALDVFMAARSIQFPAPRVGSRRLAYLGPLTSIERRLLLELGVLLHQDRRDEAWSHLLGLTHLATRYKPDPEAAAQMVRSQFIQAALTAYWSFSRRFALTQEELESLLESWREADVLRGALDMVAFARCEYLLMLNEQKIPQGFSHTRHALSVLQLSPTDVGSRWGYFKSAMVFDVKSWFDDHRVLYQDGLRLIRFSCERERALHHAIRSGESWPEIRRRLEALPGPWPPLSPATRAATIHSLRSLSIRFQARNLPPDVPDWDWVPIVEAESLRRLAVAGLMLRIQAAQRGVSPADAKSLPPIPNDFRTGEPFLYQRIGVRDFELRSAAATNGPTPVFDPEAIYPRLPRKTPLAWPSQSASP